MSKTKTVSKKKTWKLYEGVGFNPNDDARSCEFNPAGHCVVLMQSMHSGTQVFGPFLSRDAAYKWLREQGDGELYMRFDQAAVPGVSFHVDYLDVPTTRGA